MPTNLDAATLRAVARLREALDYPKVGAVPYVELASEDAVMLLNALAEAAAPRPVACPHGDPSCPCQDGDPCHYEATATTKAMMPPIEVGDWVYREGAQNGSVAVVVQPVDLPHLARPWVVETITEIRKADGRVWRRT